MIHPNDRPISTAVDKRPKYSDKVLQEDVIFNKSERTHTFFSHIIHITFTKYNFEIESMNK